MRQPLIIANWKMNGSKAFLQEYFEQFEYSSKNEVGFCVPSVYLHHCSEVIDKSINLGAQNCHFAENGAFTGEISAFMLADLGCKYAIIGHSERREQFSESGELLTKKVSACVQAGLIPVFCVGENLAERDDGKTLDVLQSQMQDIAAVEDIVSLVVAYEPIWAIGTGKTATPDMAQKAHRFIRDWLKANKGEDLAQKTRILYGGSVKSENAKEIFAMEDIDGGLVGGASLKPDEFFKICTAV